MDFHFVDEEEGKKGLEDGDYYMVVTLPSDLSEKAASILTNHQSKCKSIIRLQVVIVLLLAR